MQKQVTCQILIMVDHTYFLFTHRGTTISLRYVKQTIATTLSNHAKCLALHESS